MMNTRLFGEEIEITSSAPEMIEQLNHIFSMAEGAETGLLADTLNNEGQDAGSVELDIAAANWFTNKSQSTIDFESRLKIMESQSRLSLAIIFQTARDYSSVDRKNKQIKVDARRWLQDTRSFAPYTLRYCCAIINAQLNISGNGPQIELTPVAVADAIINDTHGFLKALSASRTVKTDSDYTSQRSPLSMFEERNANSWGYAYG